MLRAIRQQLKQIECNNEPEPAELEEVLAMLKMINSPPNTVYHYSDLYPMIAHPVPEEKRRIVELLTFYNYEPKLEKVKNKLVLSMSPKAFFFCQRHLKVLEAGWLYLLYSDVYKYYKVGLTESTMKRRLTNYSKSENWKEVSSKFCCRNLRHQESELKRFCAEKFRIAKGDEYFYLEKDDVETVKLFIDFVCL